MTPEQVLKELEETRYDLEAFRGALHGIERRLVESRDEERFAPLEIWSGTHAVVGALRLSIQHIEHQIMDLQELILRGVREEPDEVQ